MSVATKPDLVVLRVTSLADPSMPVHWAGKDILGVSIPKPSPIGLRGWRTREEAQAALRTYLGFIGALVGAQGNRYEVVVMTPKKHS